MSESTYRQFFRSAEMSERLDSSINAFSRVTKVPVTFYGGDGAILTEYSPEKKVCRKFKIYGNAKGKCRSLLNFAGTFSYSMGEPYIFFCRAGLSNIAVPLIVDDTSAGYFIAGPFIMKKLKSSSISNFVRMNAIDDDELKDILDFVGTIPVFSIEDISSLALLFYDAILSPLKSSANYQSAKKNFSSQTTISEMIRQSKKDRLSSVFPAELTDDLINFIISGKTDQAKKISSQILERLYVLCLGDLDEIKTMTLWITATVIKSFSGEGRFSFGEFAEMDMDIINRINEASTREELSETFLSLINQISSDLVSSVYSGTSPLIARSLRYIKNNFSHRIRLSDIADELHVNPTYFSAIFSHEMGTTFTDYVLDLRVKKAKELLSGTNMNILDISGSCGFENQSYFTKIFRKRTGMTPRQYRQNGPDTDNR